MSAWRRPVRSRSLRKAVGPQDRLGCPQIRTYATAVPSRYAHAARHNKSGTARHDSSFDAAAVRPPLPDPHAALRRITIPQDAVARISSLVTPGSALIISDNKLSSETGAYTDFVVLTP